MDQSKFTAANINYGTSTLPTVTVADGATAGIPAYAENTHYVVEDKFYSGEEKTEKATSALSTSGSGQYWLKIVGKGTYEGQSFYLSFWIIGTSISGSTIAEVTAVTYTGSAYTPEPAVTIGSSPAVTLKKGEDFTYSYSNNTNAGIATITITGIGNYSGTNTKNFTINKANIVAADVTAPTAKGGLTYTGQAQTLVKDGTVAGNVGTFKYSADGTNWYAANDNDIKKTDAGENYELQWKVVGDDNHNDYTPATGGSITGVIEKATLVARPKAIETFYQGTLNTSIIEIDYDEFVNDETAAGVFTGEFAAPTASFATAVTTAQFAAGTYANGIVLTGGTAKNYEVIPVKATLKINPAKLKLTLLDGKTATFGTDDAQKNEWTLKNTDIDDNNSDAELVKLEYQSADNDYTQVTDQSKVKDYLTVNATNVITGLLIKAAANTAGAADTYDLTLEGGTPANGNYVIDVRNANSKKLVISAAVLTIAADNQVKIYGEKDPELTYSVTTGEASVITEDMDAQIKAALNRAEGETVGNYAITFDKEPQFNGITISYKSAKLVITRATLTITAKEQSLYTGNKVTDLGTTLGTHYTVEGLVTSANDATGTGINDEASVKLGFATAVETSSVEGHIGELVAHAAYDEGIEVTLTNEEALAANYKITKKAGKLTVIDLTTTLNLATDADNNGAITAANGTTVNVTFGSREIARETWVAMVLPFETSVTEISAAFGYAVVNIVDHADTYTGNDLHMKLWMGEIKANQPFLVKYYKADVPAEGATPAVDNSKLNLSGVTYFTSRKISSAAYDETDPRGNTFYGVYAPTNVYGHDYAAPTKTGAIKRLGSFDKNDPLVIVPTAGYFKMVTEEARIFIEEIDGSTTVIKGISTEGEAIAAEGWYTLNGVKLQSAPTQKGIYIKDGKKVFVK
ncbi:MAG: hypothetical protein IJ588_12940 [Prevotella sp.]|nr:hypothetical protein [Prevotella sp.]